MKSIVLLLLALVAMSHALPHTQKRLNSRLRGAKRGDVAATELSEKATRQRKGSTQSLVGHALKKWSLLPGDNAVTQAAAYAQGKRPVHEGIFNVALGFMPGHSIDPAALRKGVLWNDLPGPIEYDYLEVALMARDFLTGSDNDLVFATHKGCLQFWHAMSPRSGNYRFSPQNVLDFMLNAAQFWWERGVARSGARGDWWVGHIVHAIQDSFSPSHTLRSIEPVTGTTTPPNTLHEARGANCGKIYMYQDYSGQDGGRHDDAEKDPRPVPGSEQGRLQNCSIYYSWRFLHLWNACRNGPPTSDACNFGATVRPMLAQQVWVNAGPLTLAGGTVDTYKSSSASGLTSQTITVPGVGPVAVSVPSTSAANPMWDTAAIGGFLCPTDMHGSRVPTGTLPFTGVDDSTRQRDFVNPPTAPRGDFPVPSPSDGPALAVNGAMGPPGKTGLGL